MSAALLGCAGLTDLARDSEPPIQTELLQYHLSFDGIGLEAKIAYVFTNRTGGPVYIPNCRGSFYLHLDREHGGWHKAWSAGVLTCGGSPIVVESDSVFRDTLVVWGAPPGTNWYPQFDKQDPTGIYRIVWDEALSSSSDGPPIPLDSR